MSKNKFVNLPLSATYDELNSPIGKLLIIASEEGLHAILWDTDYENSEFKTFIQNAKKSSEEKTIVKTKKQLNEYFQGQRQTFDLPLVLKGTEFQVQVWQELLKIPYGQTLSYGTQAQRMGNKNKARAVGRTNGLNPIPIVIPCHRVIGNNGKLVGFAGGLEKKKFLLNCETSSVHSQLESLSYTPHTFN